MTCFGYVTCFQNLCSVSKLPEESKGQLLSSFHVRCNVCNTKQL